MNFTTDTFSISYEVLNEQWLATRTPLLMLHSALGTRKEFSKLQAFYDDRAIIIFDFPSHGESTTSLEQLSTSELAKMTLLLLDHLSVFHCDVIGYSMGGYVALELALLRPTLVRSIISHAMKFYWTPEAITAATNDLDGEKIRARSEKAYSVLSSIHSTNGFERTLALARSIIEHFAIKQLTSDDLQQLQCPLLLSLGDRDDLIPFDEIATLYHSLPKQKTFLSIHQNSPHPISKLDLVSFTSAARILWAGNQNLL